MLSFRLRSADSSLRIAFMMTAVLVSLFGAVQVLAQSDRPLGEQPYLGVRVRHDATANRCIVAWLFQGPLQGSGFSSPHMNRGDFLLSINETELHTPDEMKTALSNHRPGEEVTLRIQRTNGNPNASVPTAGDGTEIESVVVTLESQAEWSGPVARIRPESERADPDQVIKSDTFARDVEDFVLAEVNRQGIREPIDKLVSVFGQYLDSGYGANMLSRVAYGFRRPTRLVALQEEITSSLPDITANPSGLFVEAANNLDAKVSVEPVGLDLTDPDVTVQQLGDLLHASAQELDKALASIDDARQRELAETFPELVDFVADNFYINDHPDVQRMIRALNSSMEVDFNAMLDAGYVLSGLTAKSEPPALEGVRVPLPDTLFGAIEGDVIAVLRSHGRWIVFGGAGANEYDLSQIDAVIDLGGDDMYRYEKNERPQVQVVIDFLGNDTYGTDDSVFAGPASALLGVSLLVDHAGNDTYVGASRSCGAGVMGVGVLIDHGGADHYSGTRWSCGAAFYGLGAVVDLGGGNDVYTTHHFSQAIGGPRGFGIILDQSGRDLYRNNGPVASVYGTDAVYAGISQGVGFGVRMYDTGGIGVLCDLAGHDRYEAGEFSQGGAYYWALGILYDRAGRDLYYGNRYTQGFAAHQAIGILADDAGDDTYWGMTAATQSGSWDICSTLLIDRAGNDTYQADGLAQGGASMQAIAWLLDLDGTDRYNAPAGATQGRSGGNSYHYDATGCFSFSLLLDAGGATDVYSNDRPNGGVLLLGEMNDANPQNSPLHGLFIDLDKPLGFAR